MLVETLAGYLSNEFFIEDCFGMISPLHIAGRHYTSPDPFFIRLTALFFGVCFLLNYTLLALFRKLASSI
jgi:hypothetical protein